MSTITAQNIRKIDTYGGVPYGNYTAKVFPLACNSSGVFTLSNDATAVAVGDVVRIGILPAGMTLIDALAIVSDVAQAAATVKIGFQYVDGVDVAATPEDDDYFFLTTLDMATQGRTRMNNLTVAPVKLPKEAYVIVTWETAENDEASRLDVVVYGVL